MCYDELLLHLPNDIARIVQEYAHVARVHKPGHIEIKMKTASINSTSNGSRVSRISIRVNDDLIGILRIPCDTWGEYIRYISDLFAQSQADRLMAEINWSVYNEYRPAGFRPLLDAFFAHEKNLYDREIHDLSNMFITYLYTFAQALERKLLWELVASGMAGLRYCD
jgi:hypothetical protein